MSTNRAISPRLNPVEQRALRDFATRLQEQLDESLLAVTLFGSRARGTGGPDSDLDVLVVVDDDTPAVRRLIRYQAADVWLAHGGVFISTRIWSRERWERLRREPTLLIQNIQRDGIGLIPVTQEGLGR